MIVPRIARLASLIGLTFFMALPATTQPAKTPLQPADMFRLERGSDAQISPDGRTLAYVRSTPDILTDRTVNSIWIADRATGVQHRLVAQAASHPRWSPDGSRLAFFGSDKNGNDRLFVVTAHGGGTPIALGTGGSAPSEIAWSPDGSQLAFTRSEPFAGQTLAPVLPGKPADAHWAPDPIVITSPHYSHDGSAIEAPARTALFIVPAAGGTPRLVPTERLDIEGAPAWSGDGVAVVFAARPRSDTKGDLEPALYEATLASGKVRKLSSGADAAESPAVSPDGRTIAYLRHETGRPIWQVQLWLIDRDGAHDRRLSPALDRDVQDVHWLRDGRLAYSYGDAGMCTVAIAKPGAAPQIVTTRGDGGRFSLADDGTVGFALGSPERPTEAAVAGTGGIQRAAPLNETLLSARNVGRVVPFDAKSSVDGVRVPGWMILPPGHRAGQRYPMILAIHGGPWGDEGPQWRADLQMFAAAGYVVVYPNPRGSTSYGFAYTMLLPYDAPQADYDDLMDVVDKAVADKIADPTHLYVTGPSYGGIMTTWIVGKTNRFRAAVAEKPAVSLGTSTLQNDQYGGVAVDRRGLPWVNPEAWWNSSPLSLVGNVRTPTMLIVGEEDKRTPPGEAQMFYNALQLRSIPSALLLYPEASHESLGSRRSQLISKTAYTLAWFARYR